MPISEKRGRWCPPGQEARDCSEMKEGKKLKTFESIWGLPEGLLVWVKAKDRDTFHKAKVDRRKMHPPKGGERRLITLIFLDPELSELSIKLFSDQTVDGIFSEGDAEVLAVDVYEVEY